MNSLSLCPSLVVSRYARRMLASKHSYEDAIQKLNLLQSNKANLEQIRLDIKTGKRCTNLEDMEKYLMRTGVSLSKLDELSVIHVAGTKGKGSTSAMCESILRAHGLRTGLYTSPHLVAVRERVRVDGEVVTPAVFARHFHRVYDMLHATQVYEGDMPKYFAFLTVLAFNMFLDEKVDVAVVEVGIGGIVDYTNILRKVPVVGITALGLDHTSILGDTIEQIAAAKAGIMKPGCEALTVAQPAAAMRVLSAVAAGIQCPLTEVPEYAAYKFPDSGASLPVDIDAYRTNASLAVQLAHAWIRAQRVQASNRRNLLKKQVISGKIIQNGFIEINPYITKDDKVQDGLITILPNETVTGLSKCHWPGRYQVIQSDYATFYLDGAHTKESMEICAKWFMDNNRDRNRTLIFSATGDRDIEALLEPLRNIDFESVFFVIPTAYKDISRKNDDYSIIEQKHLVARCHTIKQTWELQCRSAVIPNVLECVSDALIKIKSSYCNSNKSSVLITGSLYLVGATLSILDPNLSKYK